MPYLIPDRKLAMFFSPKAGGTSLRSFMFHIENGFPFPEFTVQGKPFDVNVLLRNTLWKRVRPEIKEEYRLFAMIRDPARRFVSGFANRVGHYRELSEQAAGPELEKRGLAPDPDLDTFVAHYKAYCACSKVVARHFLPQQAFIGTEASVYERIYRLEDVPEMIDDMEERTGIRAVMPRLQTGGEKIEWDRISAETRARILEITSDDCAFSIHPAYRDGVS